MHLSQLRPHLSYLLDSKWKPQLRLSTSERDNLLRWNGTSREHFELYPLTVHLGEQGLALYLRHELRVPDVLHAAPELCVRAVLYDLRQGKHRVFSENLGVQELKTGRERFALQMGSCRLEQAAAHGSLENGALSWDLSWEPRRSSSRSLIYNTLYDSPLLPTKILTPNENVPAWGRLEIEGRRETFARAPAQQTHIWGRRYPQRWMWLRVERFARQPDCYFEAALIQDYMGRFNSPWLISIRLVYQGQSHRFVRLLGDPLPDDYQHRLEAWSFAEGRGDLHIRGVVTAEPGDYVSLHVPDPNACKHILAKTASASLRLEVLRRHGWKFQREVLLEAPKLAWYEIGELSPWPNVLGPF